MPDLKIIFAAAAVVLILVVSSVSMCGEADKGDKVLARINRYVLTVKDFNYETESKITVGVSDVDTEKIKEELLDEIVTKSFLIQEAQKQHFDKDRAFVAEIERYWNRRC